MLSWEAHYKDKTSLSQFNPDGTENRYIDIVRPKLSRFDVLLDGKVVFSVHPKQGDELIYRQKVTKPVTTTKGTYSPEVPTQPINLFKQGQEQFEVTVKSNFDVTLVLEASEDRYIWEDTGRKFEVKVGEAAVLPLGAPLGYWLRFRPEATASLDITCIESFRVFVAGYYTPDNGKNRFTLGYVYPEGSVALDDEKRDGGIQLLEHEI